MLSWSTKRDSMTSSWILSVLHDAVFLWCLWFFPVWSKRHSLSVLYDFDSLYKIIVTLDTLIFSKTFFYNLSLRYFPLLAKQHPDRPECDILSNVFAVLSAKNLSEATSNFVMDIADSLLNSPNFEPTEQVSSLNVTGCVVMDTGEAMEGTHVWEL